MRVLWFLISAMAALALTGALAAFQVRRYSQLARRPWKDIFSHRFTLITYVVLRMLVIFSLVRGVMLKEYESVLYCTMALVLFEMPMLVSKGLKIEFSPLMEVIVLLFIYAAEILGEVESYYVRVPGWDTALHTTNGFLCAAIGFCLVDMLNRNEGVDIHLSPFFVALVAFCFSMTVGVLWEFLEYAMDTYFAADAQKDTLVAAIHSVYLDPTQTNTVIHLQNIQRTLVELGDGTTAVIEGGYLDVGIRDTMKDLMVNAVGAVVFSVIGYFCAKQGKDSPITRAFIPLVKKPRDIFTQEGKTET